MTHDAHGGRRREEEPIRTTPDTIAVIVAAGGGTRFGDPRGKQFAELCGLPVASWSIIAFDAAPSIGGIVVVCPPGRVDETRTTAIAPLALRTPVAVAEGGATRQESVACGLATIDRLAGEIVKGDDREAGRGREREAPAFVAVHDGARPLVSVATIEQVIAAVRDDPSLAGAIAAAPVTDTLKRVDASDAIVATTDRAHLWAAMTPQVFRAATLRTAYATAAETGFVGTDDASLVEHAGGRVRCVATPRDNLKVTFPEDLAMAAALRQT